MTFTLMPIIAIFLVNLILILLTMVDDQVVYRALTCCLPGMRVMLLEARSRLTKTKKPGQVILLIVIIVSIIVIIVIILFDIDDENACNKSKQ